MGVLEAPAGALAMGDVLHVFHQFRPRRTPRPVGPPVASGLPYGWDVCDDVLAPTGDELDCLAGSSVPVDDTVELFFVTTTTDSQDPAGQRSNTVSRSSRRTYLHGAARRINDLGDHRRDQRRPHGGLPTRRAPRPHRRR